MPPEDESGAEEGAPIDSSSDTPSGAVARGEVASGQDMSARMASLAARIDAAMEDDDDRDAAAGDQDAPSVAPATVEHSGSIPALDINLDDLVEVEEAPAPRPLARIALKRVPPPPPNRSVVVVPPRPPAIPSVKVPSIPAPRATPTSQAIPVLPVPPVAIPTPAATISVPPRDASGDAAAEPRTRPPTAPPRPSTAPPRPPTAPPERAKRPTAPPTTEEVLGGTGADLATMAAGGVEVGTETPNIVVDLPLEAALESPTVVDRALEQIGDAGSEKRAEALARELEATGDDAAAAYLAYELGELYERRLADEARAVKAYGRALTLDPSLRPNLWAIRRVFYRRGLWPNLAKLIGAEVEYARDDVERADLLVEKARVLGQHLDDGDEARAALEEAVRIAPGHQGALLELERVVAQAGDVPALLEVWEHLALAVEQPARKIAYWVEVGRAAGASDYGRAQEAFEHAAALATGATAERVARERLRIAEENGSPDDVVVAIEALATVLLAAFGPAGLSGDAGPEHQTERARTLRRELVALRRREAQLAKASSAERAWDVLQQALALSPGEPVILADLTELAEELGRYEDLAELVQSWQAVEGDPGRAMVLSIRRADALLRGGQRDEARALLASLEASAPGFVVLTSAAERDALGRKDPHALARTYLAAASAALLGTWLGPGQPPTPAPRAAAAFFVQAAELLAYDVGGPDGIDEARTALGKALEAVPQHPAALEALIELDDSTGNVAEALARLRAAMGTADADQQRALYERGIRLARSHGDLDAVYDLQRDLAELAPSELALRWRMESTLAQLGRDDERAQLLTELAAAEPDPTRRGTALVAAARLRERGGAVELATDLYRQVLALWPDDGFARESLIDLLRAQERWTELVSERRAEARALPDGPGARRALREAAWVLEVRLGDVASAAAVYEDWLARYPDDKTALEGAARARAQFGDRNGEVVARRELAELDPGAEAQWLLGRALERAGQFDEAADVFRALAVREEPSVAATSAALALSDLAAGRADTVMRLEATAALAARTVHPRLGASLAEDSGWMYALVLEDFDRAAQSFGVAISLEPARRGALLGAALVAARRSDPVQLSAAYDGLAACVQMPEAAAALHMRAAAMAAASGDLELSNQRIAAARSSAPDDTSALLVLSEASASMHVEDNEDASAMIDPLLARAGMLELRSALADDPVAQATWELDQAEALELAGRLREAGAVVAAVLKSMPGDLRALEAMRRMAKRAGDDVSWAQASYQLARNIGDPTAKLVMLREAASVFDGSELPNALELTLGVYKRILKVDPGAPELDRLLDVLRERADVRGLIAALTERLSYLDAEQGPPADMVPLLLERATVLHGLGDKDAAMADLDALLDRSSQHVEALRFRADLAFHGGDVESAVELWRRFLAAETRPQRRAEVELQLAQVLAENVNDLAGAIENLEHVVETNPEDLQLRERLLALCLRASDWARASRELRVLGRMRPTPQEKAREELRLGLMLRDRLSDRSGARLALDRARTLDPLNLDVVRELAELLEAPARAQVLSATAASFRASIVQSPRSVALYERLAQVTGWQSDVDARWLALVGVEALGTPSVDQRQVLTQGRQRLAAPSRLRLDEAYRNALRGGSLGALADLWRAIAPAVQAATGVDPAKLGFGRGDKVAIKKLGDKYEALAIALACFGIENAELYVSSSRVGLARVMAADTPILCIGADVATGAMPQHRFLLGRAVAMLAEELAPLGHLREGELGWTLAAALRAADIGTLPAGIADALVGEEATIAERAKVLKKQMSRKQRATVQELVKSRTAELSDLEEFRQAALAVGYRAGLLWAGDLAVAHAQMDVGKGGRALVDSPAALELTAWSISEDHLKLRERLGVGLKGGR